jgi:hypothetical protein
MLNHKHDGLNNPSMMSHLYTVEQMWKLKGYITGSCIYMMCYHHWLLHSLSVSKFSNETFLLCYCLLSHMSWWDIVEILTHWLVGADSFAACSYRELRDFKAEMGKGGVRYPSTISTLMQVTHYLCMGLLHCVNSACAAEIDVICGLQNAKFYEL